MKSAPASSSLSKPNSSAAPGTDSSASVADPPPSVSADLRHEMIATAAYYRAEQRGFGEGAEVEDWLAAEAEIDGPLGT